MKPKTIFLNIIVISCSLFFAELQSQPILHFQNSNSRAISMAGAFTSVQDFHNSLSWNPAGLILAKDRSKLRSQTIGKFNFDLFSFGFGFVALGIHSLADPDEENESDEIIPYYLQIFAYSFRGITFINSENLLISLNLHEDLLDYETSFSSIFDNSYQTAIVSYKLGRELSIGTSLSYYQTNENGIKHSGLGYNLGLQYNSLRFKGLTYGFTWFKFANDVKHVRSRVERIFDNSLTFGLSYELKQRLIFAVDVKNINGWSKYYFCETHVGFEEEVNENFYARQGFYFKNNELKKFVKSLGIGYRTGLFKSLKDRYLDMSIGVLIEEKNPIEKFDVVATLRMSF